MSTHVRSGEVVMMDDEGYPSVGSHTHKMQPSIPNAGSHTLFVPHDDDVQA